jgi:NTE family protein
MMEPDNDAVRAERCLVLGGGGVAGIAWEIGVLAGLAQAGVKLADADLFVGTSAGSVVGAQLAHGESIERLLIAQTDQAMQSQELFRPYSQAAADAQNRKLMDKVDGDLLQARLRIGAFALRSETVAPIVRRAIVAARLPRMDWPERPLRVVAVDTATARTGVFDAASGVDFVDAIAASCAVPGTWPPVEIAGARYMDGGIRSMTNADLAVGARRVVVLAPLGFSECETLRQAGALVTVAVPDSDACKAIGDNVLDPARRAPAAQAGYVQGMHLAAQFAAMWR